MATKTAATGNLECFPLATSVRTTPVTIFWGAASASVTGAASSSGGASSPMISVRVAFHRTEILSCSRTRWARTEEARKESRRCTTVTDLLVRASTSASSMAVSPPPTTTTSLSKNAAPSHVAHELTPPPRISYSPGTSSHRLSAPVATTTACVSTTVPVSVVIRKIPLRPSSMDVTVSASNKAPALAACSLILATRPGPVSAATPG
mmetsp:Transcript_32326/g.64029  ORF Transcript_32326/g.64029 Transcript_32326/m.64029 type:complete len:207 (-) Transcript_32326:777-1397(-)